jgi:hypothetical protein
MPITPQPAALAAAMIGRGAAGSAKPRMPPALSSRLVIAWITSGRGVWAMASWIAAGDPPGADSAFGFQGLHSRDHMIDIGRPGGGELVAAVLTASEDVVIGADIRVQEIDVRPLQPHGRETGVQRRAHLGRRRLGRWAAEIAFGGEAQPGRRRALKGVGYHGLAVAIERRGVDQIDAGVHRLAQGGHRLGLAGLTPDLAKAAAAEGQAADIG